MKSDLVAGMHQWIALFRGINVGGHHVVPMKELAALMTNLGCVGVRTYIQSGNVVFRHDQQDASQLSRRISSAVNERFGFEPQVLLLSAKKLAAAADANPFPVSEQDAKTLHLWFLAKTAVAPDTDGLARIRTSNEEFLLQGRVFYLHAPDGIGRSKLAAKVEKLLGVPATARNWRTVSKLVEMVKCL